MSSPESVNIELFAGPGGWDVAARLLGVHPEGLEWDEWACATAIAAGFSRLQAPDAEGKLKGLDVAATDPESAALGRLVRLLLGSPPCQAFSPAGKGKGRAGAHFILMGVQLIAWGNDPVQVCKWVDEQLDDDRAALVLEPLRWALALMPESIVLEQVATVLPLWEAMAEVLRNAGYSVWCGNMMAEQYDTPQTRKRAILIASRVREVGCPPPVRRKYRKFKDGTSNRTTLHRLDDPSLPCWISMGEALQVAEAAVLRSNYGSGGDPANRGERTTEEPAATVTSKANRGKWQYAGAGATSEQTSGQIPQGVDQPAHTVLGGGSAAWVDRAGEQGNRQVTVQEAAILQGFPADYPWQGNKGQQHRQVGDAIPPPLAWHIIREAPGLGVAPYPETEHFQ